MQMHDELRKHSPPPATRDEEKAEARLRKTLAEIDEKQANGTPLTHPEKRILQHLRHAYAKMKRAEAKPETAQERKRKRKRRLRK